MERARAVYCVNCGGRLESDARFCHLCGAPVVDLAPPVGPSPVAPPVEASPVATPVETWPADWSSGAPLGVGAYATTGERFVALIIDLIILSIVTWLGALVLGVVIYVTGGTTEAADAAVGLITFAMITVAHWLYFAVLESSDWQATVGKRAMKIIVTDEQGRGLSFARATGRSFARMLSGLFFFAGYLLAVFTARRQTLHDLLASTIVLKR